MDAAGAVNLMKGWCTMAKATSQAQVDMTIQTDRGTRKRFLCQSDDDFRVKAYSYFLDILRNRQEPSKRAALLEVTSSLSRFSFKGGNNSFSFDGFTVMPSMDFASVR